MRSEPHGAADGKWTVDRIATQIDLLPPPPVPFDGARAQRERESQKQTLRLSVPL